MVDKIATTPSITTFKLYRRITNEFTNEIDSNTLLKSQLTSLLLPLIDILNVSNFSIIDHVRVPLCVNLKESVYILLKK